MMVWELARAYTAFRGTRKPCQGERRDPRTQGRGELEAAGAYPIGRGLSNARPTGKCGLAPFTILCATIYLWVGRRNVLETSFEAWRAAGDIPVKGTGPAAPTRSPGKYPEPAENARYCWLSPLGRDWRQLRR